MTDWGVVFGLTGVGVGLISLVYARTQAINARRQADAAHLSGTLQARQEMTDRIHQARMELLDRRGPPLARRSKGNVKWIGVSSLG